MAHTLATRQKMSESQRERFAQLRALERGRQRAVESLLIAAEALRLCATEHPDAALSRYCLERVDAAFVELNLANYEGHEFVQEVSAVPNGDAGHRRDDADSRS